MALERGETRVRRAVHVPGPEQEDARRRPRERARLWLRHQPGGALARGFHERVAGAKGRMRRIMLVAMARKLIVPPWRYVTTGAVPDGAVLKA